MRAFSVTARGERGHPLEFSVIAFSSCDAAMFAAELFGDEPCKVNVTPLRVS